MSLTVSMLPRTAPAVGSEYCGSSPSPSRVVPSKQTFTSPFGEISKVKGKAARVFKPTRPEYEKSFGVQLSSLHGRCRWSIVDQVASIWGELRDTLQEALGRPDQNIFKGLSIREPPILHCYMIGYDQKCAHPTIAICHPIPIVLNRSVKLVSGMVKKHNFKTLTVESEIEPLARSKRHECGLVFPKSAVLDSQGSQGFPTNLCGVGLVINGSSKRATLGGVVIIDGRPFGLTVAHAFNQDCVAPVAESSATVRFYDSSGDEESDSGWSDDCSDERELKPMTKGSGTEDEQNSSTCRELIANFSGATNNNDQVSHDGVFHEPQATLLGTVACFPEETTEGLSYDWALVELNDCTHLLTNRIRGRLDAEPFSVTQISQKQPQGNVLVATRRGVLVGMGVNFESTIQEKFGTKLFVTWSVQLLTGQFEPGDSGSWVVDSDTGDLYGTLVAGMALLGTGYIVPATTIFSDISHKAKAGVIDFLPGNMDVDPHLPMIALADTRGPFTQVRLRRISSPSNFRPVIPAEEPSDKSQGINRGQAVKPLLSYSSNKTREHGEEPSSALVQQTDYIDLETPESGFIPYASHVALAEMLQQSMKDPLALGAFTFDICRILAIPSSASPIERFLTPNWVEDADNWYARINMRCRNVDWQSLSTKEARYATARTVIHEFERLAISHASSVRVENGDSLNS